jgi:hypothetical protein
MDEDHGGGRLPRLGCVKGPGQLEVAGGDDEVFGAKRVGFRSAYGERGFGSFLSVEPTPEARGQHNGSYPGDRMLAAERMHGKGG